MGSVAYLHIRATVNQRSILEAPVKRRDWLKLGISMPRRLCVGLRRGERGRGASFEHHVKGQRSKGNANSKADTYIITHIPGPIHLLLLLIIVSPSVIPSFPSHVILVCFHGPISVRHTTGNTECRRTCDCMLDAAGLVAKRLFPCEFCMLNEKADFWEVVPLLRESEVNMGAILNWRGRWMFSLFCRRSRVRFTRTSRFLPMIAA